MKIDVKVIPGAKKNAVRQDGDLWKVYLSAPAVEGKANKALVEMLADYFQVPKNRVGIIKGWKSRHKTISIEGI